MDIEAMQLLALQGGNWQRSGGQGEKPTLFPRPEEVDPNAVVPETEGVPVEQIRDVLAERRERLRAEREAAREG